MVIGYRTRFEIPRVDLMPLRVLYNRGMVLRSRGQPNSMWRFLTAARYTLMVPYETLFERWVTK